MEKSIIFRMADSRISFVMVRAQKGAPIGWHVFTNCDVFQIASAVVDGLRMLPKQLTAGKIGSPEL